MTKRARNTQCLNCGNPAGPHYCAHCGQEVRVKQGPLLEIGREILSDWLSLDSRLLRSLRALLVPGRATELHVAGRRAPYMRPFRLYLLASVVLFTTPLALDAPDATEYNLFVAGERIGEEVTDKTRRELDILAGEGLASRLMLEVAGDRIDRLLGKSRQEVLDLLFAGWRRALPSTLILFVPFLALGLKLIYIRGRAEHTHYVDHLVFAFHFQSALFFAATWAWAVAQIWKSLSMVGVTAYAAVAILMIMVYLPMALKRFYRQSWLWTAVKTLAVLFVYSRLLSLAIDLAAMAAIWKV